MKKFWLLLLGVLFFWVSSATYQSYSDTWLSPEYKSMNFQATLENNTVAMTWAPFTLPAGHSFVYWKVMRSQKTDNPVYKEANSDYVTYNSNLDFTRYTDKYPKQGSSRYRICAITKANDGYHRYCSNEVKKLKYMYQNMETKTEPTVTSTTVKPVVTSTTSLTATQVAVVDEIANQFLAKLETKYSDVAKRNEVISNVITQLETLAKRRTSMKPMIDYLNSKLEAAIDTLEEIKNILDLE